MSDIFLSYSRADRDTAEHIAHALEQHGWSVWWDRQIPAGKTFDAVIEEELRLAKCVVVVWSRNSVESNWVRTEADEGSKQGVLVPVTIDDSEPPFAFRRIQAASLVGWSGKDDATFAPIAAAVQLAVDAEGLTTDLHTARVTKAGWEAPPDKESRNRRLWLPATALVATIVILGVSIPAFFDGCDDIECRAQVTRLLDAEEVNLTSQGYVRVPGGSWEADRLQDDRSVKQTVPLDSATSYALLAACDNGCNEMRVVLRKGGLEVRSVNTDSSAAILGFTGDQGSQVEVDLRMETCSSQHCAYGLRLLSRAASDSTNRN